MAGGNVIGGNSITESQVKSDDSGALLNVINQDTSSTTLNRSKVPFTTLWGTSSTGSVAVSLSGNATLKVSSGYNTTSSLFIGYLFITAGYGNAGAATQFRGSNPIFTNIDSTYKMLDSGLIASSASGSRSAQWALYTHTGVSPSFVTGIVGTGTSSTNKGMITAGIFYDPTLVSWAITTEQQ